MLIECCFYYQTGLQPPDILSLQCTSLAITSEIFGKVQTVAITIFDKFIIAFAYSFPCQILGKFQLEGRANSVTSPLQHLQKICTQKQPSTGGKMMWDIYPLTKDTAFLLIVKYLLYAENEGTANFSIWINHFDKLRQFIKLSISISILKRKLSLS